MKNNGYIESMEWVTDYSWSITPTWHLKRAKAVLDEWYIKAEYNLTLIDKYKIRHRFLSSKKAELDGNCRRQALVCKTYGLIFHDQYKMMLDGCWRKSTRKYASEMS